MDKTKKYINKQSNSIVGPNSIEIVSRNSIFSSISSQLYFPLRIPEYCLFISIYK